MTQKNSILILILLLITPLVFSEVYIASPTSVSGTSLSSNSFYNNTNYDGPTSTNNWTSSYVGDFNTTGQTGTVTKIELCFDLYTNFVSCSRACDNFFLEYSIDGNENSPTRLQTISQASVNYVNNPSCFDVSSDFGTLSWNSVGQLNMHINAEKLQGSDNFNLASRWLYSRVTYDPPDTTPTNITALLHPEDNDNITYNKIDFNFTANDNKGISACYLFGNFSGGWTNFASTNTITNNVETNITYIVSNDGIYKWNINCSDEAGNSAFYTTNYTFILDTTPPIINLEYPPDNTLEQSNNEITFYFNATDDLGKLASCKLIINDEVKETKNSPPEDTSLNFTISLTNGQHNWSVNCTDTNGFENSSEIRNITLNLLTSIVSASSSREQGQNVSITGENWNNNVQIILNLTLSNSSIISWQETTTGSGTFSSIYSTDYNHPIGTQNLYVYESLTPSNNASTSFSITSRIPSLSVDKTSYFEGETIFIKGSKFSPNSPITLNFSFSEGYDVINTNSDDIGNISTSYGLSFSTTLGTWNLTGVDSSYNNLNKTISFTIEDRIATLNTNKNNYNNYEDVNFTGEWYYSNGLVEIRVWNSESMNAPGYPKTFNADSFGEVKHVFKTEDSCTGTYYGLVVDQTYNELNASVSFNITQEYFENSTRDSISSGYNSKTASSIAVSTVNESDGTYERMSLTTNGETQYFELNFNFSLAEDDLIDSVTIGIEHREGSADKISAPSLRVFDGSNYELAACSFSNTQSFNLETCDISSFFDSVSDTNLISARVYYSRGPGGTQTADLDYTYVNITYQEPEACNDWQPSNPPSITSLIVDDGFSSPSNEIVLVGGSNTTVYCNATISDPQGYTDINFTNASFFMEGYEDSIDDGRYHYSNNSCSLISGSGNIANYSCVFNLNYYASPGNWSCKFYVEDLTSFYDVEYVNTTILPLYAIQINENIDYGNVPTGSLSNEENLTIFNRGNMPFNISLYGYAVEEEDNYAMNCSNGTIPIENQKYSLTKDNSFSIMTPLSSSSSNLNINIEPSKDTQESFEYLYWKLQIPNQMLGKCNGTVVISAVG